MTNSFNPDVTYKCMNENCTEYNIQKTVTLPALADKIYAYPNAFCSDCLSFVFKVTE